MPTLHSAFLLFFRDTAPETYKVMSAEQHQQLLVRWNEWYESLAAAGKLRYGHPLEPDGRVVGRRGERVTDGPFAESKEAIGGYFFLNVANLREATEIARGCPSLKYGMTVEVRAVADCCHLGLVGTEQSKTLADVA